MSITISEVSFEHYSAGNALGIGSSSPRISWKYSGQAENWTQSSYEIIFTRSNDNDPEHHSVESADSILVPWPSKPLASGESATITIRGFPRMGGQVTKWSEPVSVEAGLLDRADWNGIVKITTPLEIDVEKPRQPVLFRRTFDLSDISLVVKARAYMTAHGVYEAHINGERIGEHVLAPGWTSYDHRLAYQTYDITPWLTSGSNTIAAQVGEGWYCGRLGFLGGARNLFGTLPGFILKMVLTLKDGSTIDLGTDQEWRANTGEITNAEIYDGESWDLALEHPGWLSADFDDGKWPQVRSEDLPSVELVASDGPPVRETQTLSFQEVITSPTQKKILDFGQNIVGRLRIKLPKVNDKGLTLTVVHAEVLENGEVGTRPLRIAKCTDQLEVPANYQNSLQFWEPKFTFHGFRYVQIDGWPTQTFESDDIVAVVLHSDMNRTGFFQCSDPLLNKLHQNIVWGMRGNFLSVPTDCPQRDERLGWTGDLAVFSPTANFLYDTAGMLSSWLKDLSKEHLADPNAVVPLVVPDILEKAYKLRPGLAIWGDATILVPWSLYQTFGDINILKSQYRSIQYWLKKGISRDSNGFWNSDPTGFGQLGDWLDPKAPPDEPENSVTDPFLVANAFLVYCTGLAGKIATALGLQEDASAFAAEAEQLKRVFQSMYIAPSGRIIADSQTAYALAIHFSLYENDLQLAVASERLKLLVRKNARFKIATGFAGTPFLPHAMTKIGASNLFYRMLMHRKCPSWLYQVKMGATTVWERWDSMLPDGSINPGEMTSFNHYALGAVGQWMHEVIGGLTTLVPGWKVFKVAPVPGGGLNQAKVRFKSPSGLVESEWKIDGENLTLKVTVPLNTQAVVVVPGSTEEKLIGSGKHTFTTSFQSEPWPPLPINNKLTPDLDVELE